LDAKAKQGFKDFLGGVKDGLGAVVDITKKVINTPGVTDLINMGTSAVGVPVPVGDMISSGLDITQQPAWKRKPEKRYIQRPK
jgi:hypothetical protein